MARVMSAQAQKENDQLMLDSGCASHMTTTADSFGRKESCKHTVNLADDFTIHAKEKGVLMLKCQGSHGLSDVHHSKTLIIQDLSLALLSIQPWYVIKSG